MILDFAINRKIRYIEVKLLTILIIEVISIRWKPSILMYLIQKFLFVIVYLLLRFPLLPE